MELLSCGADARRSSGGVAVAAAMDPITPLMVMARMVDPIAGASRGKTGGRGRERSSVAAKGTMANEAIESVSASAAKVRVASGGGGRGGPRGGGGWPTGGTTVTGWRGRREEVLRIVGPSSSGRARDNGGELRSGGMS